MALRKERPILLFFYAQELTQEQVTNIEAAFADYTVYFRKVIRNSKNDIVENFDAVAGDVPATYIAAADHKKAKVFDYDLKTSTSGTGEVIAQGGDTDLSGNQGTTTTEPTTPVITTTTPPAGTVKPSDAPKSAPAASVPPPPKE